jgi:hypothetical protein
MEAALGRAGSAFSLFGQQARLVHAGSANIVDDLPPPSQVRPGVGLEIDGFVGPVGQAILDPSVSVIDIDLIGPEEDLVRRA